MPVFKPRILIAALGAAATFGAPAMATAPLDGAPPGVQAEATDSYGLVYADQRGKTLYTWSEDRAGVSKCNGEHFHKITGLAEIVYYLPSADQRLTCQEIWAPFAASANDQGSGAWSVITRGDQSRQWAYLNKPLYTFIGDSSPGEVNASGPWRVGLGRRALLAPTSLPPGFSVKTTTAGRVLTTSNGRTLYTAKAGVSRVACQGGCLAAWEPLPAPAVVSRDEAGDWSVVERDNGAHQWAFQGKPLYRYSGDTHAGDRRGADQPSWTPVTLQAPLKPPAGFKLEVAGMGRVLADASGKTLYIFGCVDEAPDKAICDIPQAPSVAYWRSICGPGAVCTATWRPVVAAAGARPVGKTWSIVAVDPTGAQEFAAPGQAGALMVWAYKGRPVYTYAADKAPGDTYGHRLAASYYWGFGVLGDGTEGLGGEFDAD